MGKPHPCILRGIVRGIIALSIIILLFMLLKSIVSFNKLNIYNIFLLFLSLTIYLVGITSVSGPLNASASLISFLVIEKIQNDITELGAAYAIVWGILYLLRGHRTEPASDALRYPGAPSRITASISVSALVAWLLHIPLNKSIYLYISALISSLYVPGWIRPRILSTFLGSFAGIPLIGTIMASFFSSYPLESPCASKGLAIARVMAVQRPASASRSFEEELGMSCASGQWILTGNNRQRVLIVGGSLPVLPGVILVSVGPWEASLDALERDLSSASYALLEGGVGRIRLGARGEWSLVEGMASIIGSYASARGLPLFIDACNAGSRVAEAIVKAAEHSSAPVIVRLCEKPPQSIVRYFTGANGSRVVCGTRDPEIISWALSSIMGVPSPSHEIISRLASLLERGYCVSSNICGVPGVCSFAR